MSKLTSITGGASPNKMADLVRNVRENLPHTIEYLEIDAQLRRRKFQRLMAEGFTEAQALELCKGSLL